MSAAEELALSTVYTEQPTNLHTEITAQMFRQFANSVNLKLGCRILDFGCGMGVAWPFMREYTDKISAITPSLEEGANAREEGVDSYYSLGGYESTHEEFKNEGTGGIFDAIWARHSLEHVIDPFATLLTMKRFLVEGGFLYVEVPSPDTVSGHEYNPNHYSVLGDRMWRSLFSKAGFELGWSGRFDINLEIGPDVYLCYILRKPV
jgi:SAM-dependent methyltransferase